MSVVPENESSKAYLLQLQEYRRKFPEIPENDLLNIVKKYASDPETCEMMLRRESDKGMYGGSPTADQMIPTDLFGNPRSASGRNRTESTPPFDLPRSNSTGSAGSSHSSGRSTPVNPIPTPWMAPPRYSTPSPLRQGAQSMALPPGTLLINGNYYQPYCPTSGSQGQISPIDNQMGNSQTLSRVTTNRTSPSAVYPIYSTNGYFQTNVAGTLPQIQPPAMVSSKPAGPGVSIPTHFFTPARQTQGYTTAYATTSSYDRNYSQGSGTFQMATPNKPNTVGYRTNSSSNQPQDHRVLHADEQRLSNAPGWVATNSAQMDARFQAKPIGNLKNPLHVQTGPGISTPERLRKFGGPNPEELQKALGGLALSHQPPVANDDYMRACLCQQQKRLEKLQKEYASLKEKLEIIIRDITERDSGLYERKYLVEPNPTDQQVAKLSEENDVLKKKIADILSNIDRLENGHAFLPPLDSRLHGTQRFRRKDTSFDRSQSVPCLYDKPVQTQPPLSRPLSEHDMKENRPFLDNNQNPNSPDENNGEDETQWSCLRCTFLNHNSLLLCEMCGTSRNCTNMQEKF